MPDLTFGDGPHVCIGAQLAQLEARVVVEVLRKDFPNARLAVPSDELKRDLPTPSRGGRPPGMAARALDVLTVHRGPRTEDRSPANGTSAAGLLLRRTGQNRAMPDAQRTLVVLRHAKSAWPQAVRDQQRPLAGRGRRDAPAVGRWLRANVGEISTVLCSPAARAIQTWELVTEELDVRVDVQIDDRLYGASAAELLTIVRALPDTTATVLLIGHNPGVEDLVSVLTGTPQLLKTSGIAVLAVPGRWAELGPRTIAGPTLATPRG